MLLCLAASPASAQAPRRLVPVDEAGSDPSFASFRQGLREIVRRRDLPALLKIVSHDVRGTGGSDGIEEFKMSWNVESADSPLWPTLQRILALGGTFAARNGIHEFDAPYVASRWPEDLEPGDYVAITGPRVLVRTPGPRSSAILAALSYAIVRRGAESGEPKAGVPFPIVLPDGRTGVVDGMFVWSPLDYRAGFRKTPEGWRLIHILTGE